MSTENTEIYKAELDTRNYEAGLNRMSAGLERLERLGKNVLAAYGVYFGIDKIVDFGNEIVSLGAKMETTRISFTTMLREGSEFADHMITKFQKFAQESPFNTQQVLEGAKMLTAYRYQAEEIIPVMRQIADISAGLNLNFKDAVWLVGHTKSVGHLDRRILREFTLRGIGIDEAIEKTKGISHAQFEHDISKRLITYKDVAKALEYMTSKEGQFFNLSEKLSKSTLGRWERLKDTLEIIGTKAGEQLLPMLNRLLDLTFEEINKIKDVDMTGTIANFEAVGRSVKNITLLFSDLFNTIAGENSLEKISQSWRASAHILSQSALLARISLQSTKDFLEHPTELRYRSPELMELQRQFREANEAYKNSESEIDKKRATHQSKIAMDRVHEMNDLYNGNHKGFIFKRASTRAGSEEDEGNMGISERLGGVKNITINITKLVETINIMQADLSKGKNDVIEQVKLALLTGLTDANALLQH